MILKDHQIKEFQKLYLEEYGKEISLDEARDLAVRLVGLYKAVYLPELVNNQ